MCTRKVERSLFDFSRWRSTRNAAGHDSKDCGLLLTKALLRGEVPR